MEIILLFIYLIFYIILIPLIGIIGIILIIYSIILFIAKIFNLSLFAKKYNKHNRNIIVICLIGILCIIPVSITLTKCQKSIQKYKEEVNEYETKYNNILNNESLEKTIMNRSKIRHSDFNFNNEMYIHYYNFSLPSIYDENGEFVTYDCEKEFIAYVLFYDYHKIISKLYKAKLDFPFDIYFIEEYIYVKENSYNDIKQYYLDNSDGKIFLDSHYILPLNFKEIYDISNKYYDNLNNYINSDRYVSLHRSHEDYENGTNKYTTHYITFKSKDEHYHWTLNVVFKNDHYYLLHKSNYGIVLDKEDEILFKNLIETYHNQEFYTNDYFN